MFNFNARTTLDVLQKSILVIALSGFGMSAIAVAEPEPTAQDKIIAEQKSVTEAQAARDDAQKNRDALAAQHASAPTAETERKLKDSDYALMMANSKLSSAKKALERAQKKLDETKAPEVPSVTAETAAEKKAAEEKARKDEAAKLAAQKASQEAAKKAAEEQARKDEAAKLAAQKAEEEAARKKAEEEAAAKKRALAAELGIDINNCAALPTTPTNPSTAIDAVEQANAQGFQKQVNQLIAKKTADDVAPISPAPALEGTKLKPCDPAQKQALKFVYMGNGQYQLETPVLAGEQVFSVKNNIVQPLNRTIPESDNGEVYVFFLDGREGRTKLSGYKKSLLTQNPQ